MPAASSPYNSTSPASPNPSSSSETKVPFPAIGVCYYPEHWPAEQWDEDARRMAEIGIEYVRIGEFAWSRLEPRPNELDFGWLVQAMDVLGKHGLKVIVGTPTATPPRWLLDK